MRSQAPAELVAVSAALAGTEEGRGLLRAIEERRLDCVELSPPVLDSLQDARSAQPIVMLLRRPEWSEDAALAPGRTTPLIVVAHGIQDPGNLGGLLRTAHAAGASGCFVCGEAADLFHPRTVRAGMGAVFRLPAFRAEADDLLERLDAKGIQTLAADAKEGTDYPRCDLTRPLALFFGGEGAGLPSSLVGRIGERLRIPMRAGVESLSVGAAAAVVLFEAARQRRGSPTGGGRTG